MSEIGHQKCFPGNVHSFSIKLTGLLVVTPGHGILSDMFLLSVAFSHHYFTYLVVGVLSFIAFCLILSEPVCDSVCECKIMCV